MRENRVLRATTIVLILALLLACSPLRAIGIGKKEPTATPTPLPPSPTPTAELVAPTDTPAPKPTNTPELEQATATPAPETEEATVTPESAATEEAEEVVSELPGVFSSLADVHTYRGMLQLTYLPEGASPEEAQTMTLTEEVDRDNNAQRTTLSGTLEGEDTHLEIIVIGQDTWMWFGEGWMHTSSDEETGAETFAADLIQSADEFTRILGNRTLVEKGVEVNGIATNHYTFDETSIADIDQDEFEDFEGTVRGDAWISQDGKYLVKWQMHAEGTGLMEEDEAGTMDLTWELLSINEPVDIQPPEGAEGGMLPIMEGAIQGSSMSSADFATFEIKATVEEVFQWYEATLTGEGWTKDSEEVSDFMSTAEYSKDGETISITVMESDTEGVVSVMVTKG